MIGKLARIYSDKNGEEGFVTIYGNEKVQNLKGAHMMH